MTERLVATLIPSQLPSASVTFEMNSRQSTSVLLAAIDPATRYTSMQPPSAKLCSHPVQPYAVTDWVGQNIIHAVGVSGKSQLVKTPFYRM